MILNTRLRECKKSACGEEGKSLWMIHKIYLDQFRIHLYRQMPPRNILPSDVIEIANFYLDNVGEIDVSWWHFDDCFRPRVSLWNKFLMSLMLER